MTSAALGAKVAVETLDGPREVVIKPGFISGNTVILKELGMSKLRGNGRGELIVHIEVTTPSKLNKEQEEILKALAKSRGERSEDIEIHRRSAAHTSGFFGRFRDAFNR